MKLWTLIDSGFQSGAFNMAFDEALFRRALCDQDFRPTLRIYGFRRPTITYGYSQKVARHWLEDPFYDSARRLTGGGLVFHGKDLVYSYIGFRTDDPNFSSLAGSYRAFHEVVRDAFRRLRLRVDFAGASPGSYRGKSLCFLAPVKDDLLFEGKKVAGAAEKHSGKVFLHQGSVNFRAFLRDENSYVLLFDRFKSAFLAAWKRYFGVDFVVQFFDDESPTSPAGKAGLAMTGSPQMFKLA